MSHLLFSYGTLLHPEVQEHVFGRTVPTTEDRLPGFRQEWVTATDPEVVRVSGSDRHPILRRGREVDSVAGSCLDLDDAGLAAADDYEVDDYHRVSVTLVSGREAWVYVGADQL